MTEPFEPSTLPKRVDAKTGPVEPRLLLLAAVMSLSPINLVVPITFVGFTALSELVKMTFSTLFICAAVITF